VGDVALGRAAWQGSGVSSSFPGWDWEDPDSLAQRFDEFTATFAECGKLEVVPAGLPHSQAEFRGLGISGIEFAAFRTRHPQGLSTDIVSMRGEDGTSEPGPLYRVDGESYFTELDIARPLPFADGSVDWVYAEHLIEHVPLPVAISWLAEVRRILAPGGLVRLTTPDLAVYAEGYASGTGFFTSHARRLRMMRVGPPMPQRKAFMLNQVFYLYGHRWIYDVDEVRHALTEAGFLPGAIKARSFRVGARQDVADLDTTFRNDESIYLEAAA
jgi:predicted SAM-dependent methyltransferase